MDLDVQDSGFVASAMSWLAELPDDIVVDWNSVLTLSPGYYPSTLHRLWRVELTRRHLLPRADVAIKMSVPLPVAHAQDCEWHFTHAATHKLLTDCLGGLPEGATILHLGSPSTFRMGVEYYGEYAHVLVDRNPAIAHALAHSGGVIHTLDLECHAPPCMEADAAILDPPWYVDDTLAFLAGAASSTRQGAEIWLCQPTLATRPGVEAERENLLRHVAGLGLDFVEISPSAVRYRTPHFELMSLRMVGVSAHGLSEWRVGDVLRFRRTHGQEFASLLPPRESWMEVGFGPVRIKVRDSGATSDLETIIEGDVLRTVSRRDPLRVRIGLWTSGNRVLGCGSPDLVCKFVLLCNDDLISTRFSLPRALRHAKVIGLPPSTAKRLFDVLLLELQEHLIAERGP